MKAYTLYFYSPNRSCILYFSIDGHSKERALKMGRRMAKLMVDYYKSDSIGWGTKITVEVEEYKAKAQ